MIYLNDSIIVTPPKNASTSLHDLFCPPGIFLSGEMDKHTTKIVGYSCSRVFFVVRNPFDRAVSLYEHYKFYAGYAKSFEEFTIKLINDYHYFLWPMFMFYNSVNCYRKVNDEFMNCRPEMILLRVEKLGEDLRANGFEFTDLPMKHKRVENPLKYYNSDSCWRNVEKWAGEDFRLFGYIK